ncbi:LOW QUALITY PROTEIN: AP-5 complex subunit beta-1 [Sceloporus undulatus]|uniref:LOW QUALITY PROTEIN: AP-5 complex subunit beta-1 n=1 Tax=Sceloporus undulatus TaxID=8520 RepID=UPI001C4CE935|nr:LOW QUALITY PROTEIN: AP-5 complex subunit beta-1 [Sceloporus undulatus]
MGSRGAESWAGTIASFRSCPTAFLLSHGTSDTFVAELLRELHSDRLGDQIKISMLMLLLDYPTLLCPDAKAGQEMATSILSFFAQLGPSPKQTNLRCHLLFAVGTILVATEAFGEACQASRDYLTLLLDLASDLSDRRGGISERPVRSAACECLRELETCYPGFLSGRLETLRSFQQQEVSLAHQGYTLLYGAALRNAILLLAWSGKETLGQLLARNEGLVWEAVSTPGEISVANIDQLVLLPSPGDLKELKSVVSALLDNSYFLSPAAQSHLLWQLAQAVSVVRTQSPAIFKAQLVRLFGTVDVALQHSILQLKSLFTDSLFTAEDEAFLLRRLVGLAQHPALPAPVKLFHLDCLLHFPENRPLGSGAEEGLPVLLTPRTVSGLFPGLFQDQGTVLARLNLLCLVCVESEGPIAERGTGYLLEHVLALGGAGGPRRYPESVCLFFRVAFLFARYFGSRAQPMAELTQCFLDLYRQNCALAPNIINLLDEAWRASEEAGWAGTLAQALQELIVDFPGLKEKDLGWHLKVLARLAKEKDIPQASTLRFLRRLVAQGQLGDWRSGQILLSVCRNLMQLCPPPDPAHLADLLQAVSISHVDMDVQDRARFYYTLLANLSEEKLGAVLALEGPAKARALSSSIVADSESFVASLTVHPVAPAPLRLQRMANGGDVPTVPRPEQDVEGYCQWLMEARPPSQLRLTYQLVHVGPSSPPYELLLCVVLRFSCANQHYEPVPELCVPCLSAHRPPQTLTLALTPRSPYPTQVNVSALYTTQEGLTRCSQLEPVEVAFSDLFMPLSVPSWPSEKRHQLFSALWHRLGPDATCSESLTVWHIPPQSLDGLVHHHFAQYLLGEQPGCYEIGMALPPQCHVLLRVESVAEAARVGIRTDDWKLLPSLNSYLQSLVTAT